MEQIIAVVIVVIIVISYYWYIKNTEASFINGQKFLRDESDTYAVGRPYVICPPPDLHIFSY